MHRKDTHHIVSSGNAFGGRGVTVTFDTFSLVF